MAASGCPHFGESRFVDKLPVILNEYNTLNPETFRFTPGAVPLRHVKTRVGRSRRLWARLGGSGTRLGGSGRILDDQRRARDAWDFRTRARDSPATAALVPFAVSHHVARAIL